MPCSGVCSSSSYQRHTRCAPVTCFLLQCAISQGVGQQGLLAEPHWWVSLHRRLQCRQYTACCVRETLVCVSSLERVLDDGCCFPSWSHTASRDVERDVERAQQHGVAPRDACQMLQRRRHTRVRFGFRRAHTGASTRAAPPPRRLEYIMPDGSALCIYQRQHSQGRVVTASTACSDTCVCRCKCPTLSQIQGHAVVTTPRERGSSQAVAAQEKRPF